MSIRQEHDPHRASVHSARAISTGIIYLPLPESKLVVVQPEHSVDFKRHIEDDLRVRYRYVNETDLSELLDDVKGHGIDRYKGKREKALAMPTSCSAALKRSTVACTPLCFNQFYAVSISTVNCLVSNVPRCTRTRRCPCCCIIIDWLSRRRGSCTTLSRKPGTPSMSTYATRSVHSKGLNSSERSISISLNERSNKNTTKHVTAKCMTSEMMCCV